MEKIEDPKNHSPNFLKRAQIVLTSFNSQLKARFQRTDHSVNLLQVYLTESSAQAHLETQVRKLLKPSTSTSDFIPEKLHGTFEWIWTHNKFLRCVASTAVLQAVGSLSANGADSTPDIDSRVLVMYGVNGCGKSVLATDRLRRKGNTVFSFFLLGRKFKRQLI